MWSLAALVIGFCIDLLVGDPHSFPHPVVLIGKCISVLERVLRCVCPKTPAGERAAGAILWGAVVIISTAVPHHASRRARAHREGAEGPARAACRR